MLVGHFECLLADAATVCLQAKTAVVTVLVDLMARWPSAVDTLITFVMHFHD